MSGWDEALRLGVRLGLAPDVFWPLSLREWRALTELPVAPVLNRAGLTDLIDRYPDEEVP